MAGETEYVQLVGSQHLELEEDETIDHPISITDETTTLLTLEDPPDGRHLGVYSTTVLFVCRMVGSGIFATPGGIYNDVYGSPILFLTVWFAGAFIAYTGLSVYLELGSLLPRSGATKVYLEYLFPNPKYYSAFVFGSFNVFFNISGGNALVFGQYIRYAFDLEDDEVKSRNLGICLMLFALVVHGSSRKFGVYVQNVVGGLKLLLSMLMVFVTLYVMLLPASITKIENQLSWKSFFAVTDFDKISFSVIGATVLRTIYSFGGWTSPFVVNNEIHNPSRTLRITAPLSISFVIVLYMLLNVTYLIVIPSSQLREGHELVGGILFQTLFGEVLGRRILSTIIAISSASTLLVVIFSDARMIQGISREGFLPFSKALASNFPFGTPLGALILNVCISASVLFLPKTGDLYNYVISMQIYPNQLFHAVLCVGVYKARNRFPQLKAPIRASHVSIIFCFISSVAVFIAPLSSPKSLLTSYSFGGLLMFFVFSIYWFVVVKLMPWYGGYMIYRRTVRLNHDGMKVKKWEYAYN